MAIAKTVQAGDPAWLRAAFALEGLKEIVGGKHERQILEFFADAGHSWVKDDETAWCAAFAHAMLGRGGIKGTGSLAARSYLEFGTKVTKPQRGDVVVFKRGKSSWQGHVAFWLGEDRTHVWVIGGNQSNGVTVARYTKASLLGYRRPGAASGVSPQPAGPSKGTTAKPAAPAPTINLVRAVQEQLLAKGYPEVGKIDGDVGTKTQGAILAFEADNGLPLTGEATKELLTEIMAAPHRQLSVERTEAPPKTVREKIPEVKASWLAKMTSIVVGLGSAASAAVAGAFENLDGARQWLQPAIDIAGDVPVWLYLLAVAAVAWWLWQQTRQGERAGVAAYQSGERR